MLLRKPRYVKSLDSANGKINDTQKFSEDNEHSCDSFQNLYSTAANEEEPTVCDTTLNNIQLDDIPLQREPSDDQYVKSECLSPQKAESKITKQQEAYRQTLLHWRIFAILGYCFIWGCSSALYVLLPKYVKTKEVKPQQTATLFMIGGITSFGARVLMAVTGTLRIEIIYIAVMAFIYITVRPDTS